MTRKAIGTLFVLLLAGAWLGGRALAQNPGAAQTQAAQGNMSATGPAEPVSASAPRAAETNPRVVKLGNELMCMCGCNQILIECDHQGTDRCLMHDREMAELEQRVKKGESNSLILQSFVQEYGPQVLVVPPARGFDLTAWLMPIFASLFGLSLAIIIVQRWHERSLRPAAAGAAASGPKIKVTAEHVARARAATEKEDY